MLNENDLIYFRALKRIIDRTDFEIKGEAIEEVARIKQWFNSLESKIIGDIRNQPLRQDGPVTPLNTPKKPALIKHNKDKK